MKLKKTIHKILAVGLTLVLVMSFSIIMAVPVAAGENEWSAPAKPAKEGADGDWFYDSTIADGPGPIALAIDGTLYVYAEIGDKHIFESEDGGRSWDKTDYFKDITALGVTPGTIVTIVTSSLDADVLYAADIAHVYWTQNGGGKWELVADASLQTAFGVQTGTQNITSLDVAYDDAGDPYVFVGTKSTSGYTGDVFYVAQAGYPTEWTDLNVDDGSSNTTLNVYAVAALPDFEDSAEIVALVTDDDAYTAIVSNTNGSIGDWSENDELMDEGPAAFEVSNASKFRFPADFDDEYEMFIGVSGTSVDGSVYRATDDDSYRLGDDDADVDLDIASLDITGSYGSTSLVAGAEDSAEVFVSTNDGDNWNDPDKDPSGAGPAYVVMDADFDDNGIAWVAVEGAEGAVSLTVDTGALYNQISMIFTDIDTVDSLAFSPNYASDGIRFMVTSDTGGSTDSIWRYDGDWERVGVTTLSEFSGTINSVQVSPKFASDDTLFVAKTGSSPVIYRSTDAGGDWKELNRQPTAMYAWVVVDDDYIIAGGIGKFYWTDAYGRRAWESETESPAGTITSFALSPSYMTDETVLAGDDDGGIFISEDLGDSWDQVDDSDIVTSGTTIVAFDPGYATNNTIYAGAADEVNRSVIDTDEDWKDQTWKEFTTTRTSLDIAAVTGLRVASDGTLYVADSSAVSLAAVTAVAAVPGDAFTLMATAAADTGFIQVAAGSVDVTGSGHTIAGSLTTIVPGSGSVAWTLAAAGDWVTFTVTASAAATYGTLTVAASDTTVATITADSDSDASVWGGGSAGTGAFGLPDAAVTAVSAGHAAGGLWRSLNPTASTMSDVLFEQVLENFDGSEELTGLWVTAGSNILWSLNSETSYLHQVWTYEDFLSSKVVLDEPWSNTGLGSTSKVALSWEEVTGADYYEVKVNTEDDFGSATAVTVASEDDTSVTVRDLDDGTKYYWKVRVLAGEPLRSPWSNVWVFTTKLSKVTEPTQRSPENGEQDVIVKPAFGWNSVGDSTGYNLELSTSPDFASLVTSADTSINSWAIDTTLSYSRTYYWRVRAVKDDLVISGWRSTIFTTMAKPVIPPPPVEILPPPPAPPAPVIPAPVLPIQPTPMWVWTIIGIGGALIIAVIVLIVRTRRAM